MNTSLTTQTHEGLRRVGRDERPGQMAMGAAVVAAIESGGQAIIDAPTGTGKGFGYLVPAILSGRRTVIATATKALQDQLANHDLPHLARTLGVPFTWSVVKGRSNYLCLAKLAEITGERANGQATIDGFAADTLRTDPELADGVAWARRTVHGDIAEVRLTPRVVEALTISGDECPGKKRCPFGRQCHAELAKKSAGDRDIVIVNMALYGTDIASGGMVLPFHDVLVVDEAHRFEDVTAEALGVRLDPRSVRKAIARANHSIGGTDDGVKLIAAMSRTAEDLTNALEAMKRDDEDLLETPLPTGLRIVLNELKAGFVRAVDKIQQLGYLDDDGKVEFADAGDARAFVFCSRILGRIEIVYCADDASAVFIDDDGVLCAVPLDISETLRNDLWPNVAAVMTSATIPSNLATKVGLGCKTLKVDSPFDLANNAMLYVAKALPPNPNSPEWKLASRVEMVELITAAEGRTLALFSSRRAMREAADAVGQRVPYRIITQDDGPKPLIIREFAEDEHACLFGTQGLYEGVDVPGPSCSLVIIDRVPFPRRGDPLNEARKRVAGSRSFQTVDLPKATYLLTQAAGRLIRSAEDRGVVAILDPRPALKWSSYGKELLSGLCKMRMTGTQSEAVEFLRRCVPALATASVNLRIEDVF